MAVPQLYIAFTGEGSTDNRFLENIIKRTIVDIVFNECSMDLEVEDIIILTTSKIGKKFDEYFVDAVRDALNSGAYLLIVHTDSDKDNYEERIAHKFVPAIETLRNSEDSDIRDYEQNIVPIIPLRMIEAWMLANKSIFKEEVGTTLLDSDLDITGDPERMSDPKQKINNALKIAKERSSRNKRLNIEDISELYSPLGNKIPFQDLYRLNSYNMFTDNLRKGLKALGYLY